MLLANASKSMHVRRHQHSVDASRHLSATSCGTWHLESNWRCAGYQSGLRWFQNSKIAQRVVVNSRVKQWDECQPLHGGIYAILHVKNGGCDGIKLNDVGVRMGSEACLAYSARSLCSGCSRVATLNGLMTLWIIIAAFFHISCLPRMTDVFCKQCCAHDGEVSEWDAAILLNPSVTGETRDGYPTTMGDGLPT